MIIDFWQQAKETNKNKANFLLLIAEGFYNLLIFDRGKYLTIAERNYPQIPVLFQAKDAKFIQFWNKTKHKTVIL